METTDLIKGLGGCIVILVMVGAAILFVRDQRTESKVFEDALRIATEGKADATTPTTVAKPAQR